jgi:hypothetical protein
MFNKALCIGSLDLERSAITQNLELVVTQPKATELLGLMVDFTKSIGLFGSCIMVQYLMTLILITLITTKTTIALIIFNALAVKPI